MTSMAHYRYQKDKIFSFLLISIIVFSSFTFFIGVSSSQTSTVPELQIELNRPAEGDIWSGGSEQNISFTLNTTLELSEIEVTLEYVFEGEGPYTIKIYEKGELSNYSTNYTWTVPDMDSDEVSLIIRAEGGDYRRWKMVSIVVDSTPPEFLYSKPKDQGVLLSDSTLEFVFSEEIRLIDIRRNFTLYRDTSEILGTFSGYSRNNNYTVEFTPYSELPPNSNYYFELSGTINDTSDPGNAFDIDLRADFTVKRGAPNVEVSNVIENQIRVGNTTDINWTVDQEELAEEPIDIKYSLDGGNTWTTIVSGIDDEGTYHWEVLKEPFIEYPVTNVIVNVSCENEYGFIGYGHSNRFTIYKNLKPNVDIERPYDGLILVEGGETEIRWNATDDVPLPENPITISISKDGGNSWRVISYDVKNNGIYHWTVDTSAESAILNVSCTDSDGAITWAHSPEFTILDENPLDLALDPLKETYYTREQITINWIAPPMVDDYQHIRISFSNDGESWSMVSEVEPDEETTTLRFPFAMSNNCKIMLEVVDDAGVIYSVKSEAFEVFPEVRDIIHTSMGRSTFIHISFGSWVNRGMIEECLFLYKSGEKIDLSRNEIYAMSGSDIVLLKDDLPNGDYTLELNSSDSNVEFDKRTIFAFEIDEQGEEAYVEYWPIFLMVPLITFLFYIYKRKINSNASKTKYEFDR